MIISDLDNDGQKEIIVLKKTGELLIFNHDSTNTIKLEINIEIETQFQLITADLDNDNDQEIFVYGYSKDFDKTNKTILKVFDFDGKNLNVLLSKEFLDTRNPILTIKDLDLDGEKEIIIKNYDKEIYNMNIVILDLQGKIKNKWKIENKIPNTMNISFGNFDDDDDFEIVAITEEYDKTSESYMYFKIYIFDLKEENKILNQAFYLITSFATNDFNNDNKDELIFTTQNILKDNSIFEGFFIIDIYNDKSFSYDLTKNGYGLMSFNNIILGNVDYDNQIDIIIKINKYFSDIEERLAIFNFSDNEIVLKKEIHPQEIDINGKYFTSDSILYDLNNDSSSEIIFQVYNDNISKLYAFDNIQNKILPNFTKITDYNISSTDMTVDDINNNGKIELISSSHYEEDLNGNSKNRGSIYVWETDADYQPSKMEWPTYMHDNQRTNRYQDPMNNILKLGIINYLDLIKIMLVKPLNKGNETEKEEIGNFLNIDINPNPTEEEIQYIFDKYLSGENISFLSNHLKKIKYKNSLTITLQP